MDYDFARNVTSMRIMTELGVAHGLSVGVCLAGTGVKEDDLTNPVVVVSARQELRLISNLIDHLGDLPGIGIEAGRRYHFTAFGALGFAMVSSPNARSAIDIALRYFHLTFAFTRFLVEDHGEETHITLDDSNLPEHLRTFIVERDSAALVTVQRDLFNSHHGLLGLCFSYQAPEEITPYEDFYGIRPQFGALATKAIMSKAAMLAPLPQGNELGLLIAEEQCRLLLDRHQARAGLAGKVRDLLARHIAQLPDMNAAARELCMTPRTLRRRLDEEGTTFLKLRDEVRLALAEEFLTNFALSIEQVAERLGYAESTCFINAFKRLSGKTPLVYRKGVLHR